MAWDQSDETVLAEALFASDLQLGDAAPWPKVVEVVEKILHRLGEAGCAAKLAYEYGEYPQTAAMRMRWAIKRAHETCEKRNQLMLDPLVSTGFKICI